MTPPAPPLPADRFFADLADDAAAGARLGGKARSLARLAAAGLPIPAGFVVTDALFRALVGPAAVPRNPAALDQALATAAFPPGFAAALDDRLTALGAHRFSVRSSFASEDQAGQVAAGIYDSRIGLARSDVPAALREVLRSALRPGALAYAQQRGQDVAAPPLAVLVHAFVPGDARGGAASWTALGPTGMTQQTLLDVQTGALTEAGKAAISIAAHTLAARHGPIELEWVAQGDAATFVQLRPYSPPPAPTNWPGWRDLGADESPARWSWDAAHNPLPLSPAHAGLVDLVDARCRIGIRQRVVAGYLFWAPGPAPAAAITPDQLASTIRRLGQEIDAGRAALGPAPALEAALEFFVTQYQPLLGLLPPAMRAARADLQRFTDAHLPHERAALPTVLRDVDSQEKLRRRCAADLAHATTPAAQSQARAAYLARFGDEAPQWDLACPTYHERPETLVLHNGSSPAAPAAPAVAPAWAAELDRLATQLPPGLRDQWRQLVDLARQAIAAGENDDWLYARLQAPVRHAIVALGRTLVAQGHLRQIDDVFALDLTTLRAIARGQSFAPGLLQAQATGAQAALEQARRNPPPLPPESTALAGPAAAGAPDQVRGHGCGGHALGPVVLRHGPRGASPPRDAVLLATSLLPTELPLLQVAALVTETGGPLGHVATQARERGLPAVVGAAGALALLRDGDLVIVDGATGLVTRLGPRS